MGLFSIRCCSGIIWSVAGTRLILWRSAHRQHLYWSTKLLIGSMLIGFGAFNVVEGLINHHLLGIHHVNETVPRNEWFLWDIGFLIWGAVMLVVGWLLVRAGRRTEAQVEQSHPAR